jgi:hypothetical protein
MKERNWLARVTTTISQHWQKKNDRKRNRLTVTISGGQDDNAQTSERRLNSEPEHSG